MKKPAIVLAIILVFTNSLLIGNSIQFSEQDQIGKYNDNEKKLEREIQKEDIDLGIENIPDSPSYVSRQTRANSPYISKNFFPIYAKDNEGGNPDYLNLDEVAPGDNNKERTGKDNLYAWIECQFGPAGIADGSTINGITVFIGYHCDADWGLSVGHKGMVWSPLDGSSENDIGDYPVSISDRDEIFTITDNLPKSSELNEGILIRVSGFDTDGAGPDYLNLDYLYFTVNYSIPDIVINEIMFNASAGDDFSEWVELYNAGNTQVDLTGWNLTDNDGNWFGLTGAGSIPAGGYLICHLAQSGTSDPANAYGKITSKIILQPDAAEGNDTYLSSDFPGTNYGMEPSIRTENLASSFNTLMHFNLSNYSGNGLSVSTLSLFHFDGHPSINGTINLHRLNRSWTETGASWNTSDGTKNWTTVGADYNLTIEGTSQITAGSYGWESWDITETIRGWKNGTFEDLGLILTGAVGSGWHLFYSSDHLGDPSLRPKLVLEYDNAGKMLDDIDSLSLVDTHGNVVDFVAWGDDPGEDDDMAVSVNQWVDGDFIDSQLLLEGQTLGRDAQNNDTDRKEDWQNASGFADGFGVDRGTSWGPSPGERNADPDLSGPRIRDVQSNPKNPLKGGYVNITCNVTDPDGVLNAWCNITLAGGGYINASMVNNANFKWYYNESYASIGQYQYKIWANDLMGNWSSSGVNQFEIANRAPTLSSDGVNPAIGNYRSWFNFSVIYTDLDNHPPSTITVNITNLGSYSLNQLDQSDTIFSDGKSYYVNLSSIPAGISYTFHFAAQDINGLWGEMTSEIDAPNVLPIPAVLTTFDEIIKYSDEAHLSARLMENSTPVEGEKITFYIDENDNEFYEASEIFGEGTTQGDGSVSVINRTYLVPGTYNITGVYSGSDNFDVNDAKSTLIIVVKEATLTAQNEVAEEGESIKLSALMIDESGNLVANEKIAFYLDKNRNEIFEGSELLGMGNTASDGIAFLDYNNSLMPQQYKIWAKYVGSVNYNVNEIVGILTIQNTVNKPPTIVGQIPNQIMPEDSPPWTLDLTEYEDDIEDVGSDLKWFLTGMDTTIYTVTGMNSSNDEITFIPVNDAYGNDEVILWLVDGSGAMVSQNLWINITPVNDWPYFDPVPPDLHVRYDDPTTDSDNPNPWNLIFYVHDEDTPIGNLIITTSEPTSDAGNGYAHIEDLNVTFHYPAKRMGENIIVTLTLSDGLNSAQTLISLKITSDWSPELLEQFPDIVMEENSTLYSVFDLDDYFMDRDKEIMIFSSSHQNLHININSDNTVDISSFGLWTGSELVLFRATDPIGAIAEGYCTVTVVPKNDAPVISGIPDLVVHFDYLYTFDLTPYISDGDNMISELTVWTSEPKDHIWSQQNNNLGLIINYPESQNGTTIPLTIYVSDGIEVTSHDIQISISSDFSPELINELPDVSFSEDSVLESAFLLSDYFFDPDEDSLIFSADGNYVKTTFNNNLTVDFSVPENWYGSEIITFRATDPHGALVEDRIQVIVVPVNDPPTIQIIPDQKKIVGDQWIMDLAHYIDDVDNDVSKLIINVKSNNGLENVELVGTILIFHYPPNILDDIIEITVSDGEYNTSLSFNISLSKSISVSPTLWDIVPWHWLSITLALIICSITIVYRKKSSYYVYEAFLIHNSGLALAYASREKNKELEDVIVSGMFTAIQDFINDTLSGKNFDEWKLNEMKFSKGKILIEKSQDLYVAAIFDGNGNKLRKHIKKILKDTNSKYEEVLDDWDGDMNRLEGIDHMITDLIP